MDPTAAYRRWSTGDDLSEMKEAAEDLIEWLNRGGFQPKWTAEQKRHFLEWSRRNKVPGASRVR